MARNIKFFILTLALLIVLINPVHVEAAGSYTISFNDNGASGSMSSVQSATNSSGEQVFTVPSNKFSSTYSISYYTPQNTGYGLYKTDDINRTFSYFTDSYGTKYYPGDVKAVYGNLVLYPVFSSATTTLRDIPKDKHTLKYYTSTSSDSSTILGYPNKSITINNNISVYAQYSATIDLNLTAYPLQAVSNNVRTGVTKVNWKEDDTLNKSFMLDYSTSKNVVEQASSTIGTGQGSVGKGLWETVVKAQLTEQNTSILFKYSNDNISGVQADLTYNLNGLETIQFEVPTSGYYKLDTYGASGWGYKPRNTTTSALNGSILNSINSYKTGGEGGHTSGYTYLTKGEVIYITLGTAGQRNTLKSGIQNDSSGYNGGGMSYAYGGGGAIFVTSEAGSGGGATHISKVNGVLSSSNNNRGGVIMVAGGGGGAAGRNSDSIHSSDGCGGNGGGLQGGNPKVSRDGGTAVEEAGYIDSNSYWFPVGTYYTYAGASEQQAVENRGYEFGKGMTPIMGWNVAGAGGGYYGGRAAFQTIYGTGAAGGSSYVSNSVDNGVLEQGGNWGNGFAVLTLVTTHNEYKANDSREFNVQVYSPDITSPNAVSKILFGNTEGSGTSEKTTLYWNNPGDLGTTYYFKVRSYKNSLYTGKPISSSETKSVNQQTGVKGYLYKLDTVEYSPCTFDNSTFTSSTSVKLNLINYGQSLYFHLATIDNNGNVSNTITEKVNRSTAVFELGNLGTFSSTGTSTKIISNWESAQIELPTDVNMPEGYTFKGWQIDSGDGAFCVYNPATGRFEQTYSINRVHENLWTYRYQFNTEKTVLRPLYIAPLLLSASSRPFDNTSPNGVYVDLSWREDDFYSKVYRVFQRNVSNNSDWSYATVDYAGDYDPNNPYSSTFSSVGISSYTVPFSGIYYIEAWGAEGGADGPKGNEGNAGNSKVGGSGGYMSGNFWLNAGQTIYFCVGGGGATNASGSGGGYNGGGNAGASGWSGAGGGCTSVSFVPALAKDILAYGDRDMLLIAGGGGGGNVNASGKGGGQGPITSLRGQGQNCNGDGGGGGAGYFGGTAAQDGTNSAYAGGGGYSWLNKDYGSQRGQRNGNVGAAGYRSSNGQARICPLSSSISMDTNFYGGIKAPDVTAPQMPSGGHITGLSGTTMTVGWNDCVDYGTLYEYKVMSFDVTKYDSTEHSTNPVIGKLTESKPVTVESKSTLKGYYFYTNNNPIGVIGEGLDFSYGQDAVIDISKCTFCPTATYTFNFNQSNNRYVHLAAVDWAGNISATYNFEVYTYYTLMYNRNDTVYNRYGDICTSNASGSDPVPQIVYPAQTVTISPNTYNKVGYTFTGWNTASDGTGTHYNPGDVLSYFNMTSNEMVLYAQWEPIKYTVRFNGNNNWNTAQGAYSQQFRYDNAQNLLNNRFTRPDNTVYNGTHFERGYVFNGWSDSNWNVAVKYANQQAVINLTTVDNGIIDLYAVWSKELQLILNPNTGKYNGSANSVVLKATIYNNQYTYPFNIIGSSTPAIANVYTQQIGTINGYGTYNSNGENSHYKKYSPEDGGRSRFIGWHLNKDSLIPQLELCPYNQSGRQNTYTIRDNTTLYSIWEPVLILDTEVKKVIGTVNPILPTRISVDASSGVGELILPIRAGEQGQYNLNTSGNVDNIKVEFDELIKRIYTHPGIWTDELNLPTSENLVAGNVHGLDRLLTPINKKETIERKFFIPVYLGTDKSEPSSIGVNQYYVDFTATNPDSFYYKYVFGKDEVAKVKCYITLDSDIGDSGDISIDTILNDLRTKLKIRLKGK